MYLKQIENTMPSFQLNDKKNRGNVRNTISPFRRNFAVIEKF